MNNKDLAIGVLSTTAVILLIGLILIQTQPKAAFASGMGDTGGDYKVLTGELHDREEYLYVLDTAQNKIMIYRYNMMQKKIQLLTGGSLDKYFGNSSAPKPKPKSGRRHRP